MGTRSFLRRKAVIFAATLLTVPHSVSGQETPVAAAAVVSETATKPSLTIPALTPVEVVIDVDLGSKLSKTGELFTLHLAKPVMIDGVEAVPAGTVGEGEVIHAKKGGGSGAPGELVLAARHLTLGDRQLRLRSLKLDAVGNDKMGTVNSINVAAAATIPVASVIGFFITGGDRTIPKGTILPAKTAEPFALEQATPVTSSEQQASNQTLPGNSAGTQGRGKE